MEATSEAGVRYLVTLRDAANKTIAKLVMTVPADDRHIRANALAHQYRAATYEVERTTKRGGRA